MEYWMYNYGNNCPSPWTQLGTTCYGITGITPVPLQPATNLLNLVLTGMANVGMVDSVQLCVELSVAPWETCYTAIGSPTMLSLSQVWTTSEFNVVGDLNVTEAIFNAGAELQVSQWVGRANGATTPLGCVCGEPFGTAETNNLNLDGNCQSLPPRGGLPPRIYFIEKN
jgi:hypothetical protein